MSALGVTNFAYGTGPYLRTTELLIAFNDELEKHGKERMQFVVPWVYGEKQRRIMLEDFGAHVSKYPQEILLDAKLGELLGSVFYTGTKRYEETLSFWIENAENVSSQLERHLSGTLKVETLGGKKLTVDGKDILIEINRSPRVRFNVAPSYSTTFGYVADILEKAIDLPSEVVDVDKKLLKKGAALADSIEGSQEMNLMAYPATFSWNKGYVDRYGGVLVPPITNLPVDREERIDQEGIFVTITGIEGLDRLYREAQALGLALYSNDVDAVQGSIKALPSAISNDNIKLQFARSGWGSVWLSMLVGTPIVIPKYDPTDDPEIYFNNIAVQRIGIGTVYEGQSFSEILSIAEAQRSASKKIRDDITERWGMLNGNAYSAKCIAESFLKNQL